MVLANMQLLEPKCESYYFITKEIDSKIYKRLGKIIVSKFLIREIDIRI